ncbi:hypothetical protein D9M68_689680 [compost metagenome]
MIAPLITPQMRRWRRLNLMLVLLILLVPLCSLYIYALLHMSDDVVISAEQTDRPVGSFWINDNCERNAAKDDSEVTRCRWIEGKTLRGIWILDVTPGKHEREPTEGLRSPGLPNPLH